MRSSPKRVVFEVEVAARRLSSGDQATQFAPSPSVTLRRCPVRRSRIQTSPREEGPGIQAILVLSGEGEAHAPLLRTLISPLLRSTCPISKLDATLPSVATPVYSMIIPKRAPQL